MKTVCKNACQQTGPHTEGMHIFTEIPLLLPSTWRKHISETGRTLSLACSPCPLSQAHSWEHQQNLLGNFLRLTCSISSERISHSEAGEITCTLISSSAFHRDDKH